MNEVLVKLHFVVYESLWRNKAIVSILDAAKIICQYLKKKDVVHKRKVLLHSFDKCIRYSASNFLQCIVRVIKNCCTPIENDC